MGKVGRSELERDRFGSMFMVHCFPSPVHMHMFRTSTHTPRWRTIALWAQHANWLDGQILMRKLMCHDIFLLAFASRVAAESFSPPRFGLVVAKPQMPQSFRHLALRAIRRLAVVRQILPNGIDRHPIDLSNICARAFALNVHISPSCFSHSSRPLRNRLDDNASDIAAVMPTI